MWMELLALAFGFVALKIQFVETLWKKIELVKNIWTFIIECPELLNYCNHLTEKVQALNEKKVALCCQKDDVKEQLENAVHRTGYEGKREVKNWLSNVQCKTEEVDNILQEVPRVNFLLYAWYGGRVVKHIREVEELSQQGRFPEGLVLETPQTRRVELLTTPLVGDGHNIHLENVWESLMNEQVLGIGVVGAAGIGKTFIMSHIYNQLLKNTSSFKHVYWVTVSRKCDIQELQNDIAKEVGIDLLNESEKRKRAGRLHGALKARKKSVLILDDLLEQFSLIEVGIPTEKDGCKLILTTRSKDVCRRMGCQSIITVEPLQDEEAKMLFMEKLKVLQPNSPLAPELESIAKQIVKQCHGLPEAIIAVAEKLMGIYDITEWRNALNELRI